MLSKDTIIRAWKDETFRESLSEEERIALPAHPSGLSQLTDEEMRAAAGGTMGNCYSIGYNCNPTFDCSTADCGGGGGSHEPGCKPVMA